jgi:hypothetical protein
MRSTRDKVKRAAKMRIIKHMGIRSTDGICCPHCEPKQNGKLKRQTLLNKVAQKEIKDALSN